MHFKISLGLLALVCLVVEIQSVHVQLDPETEIAIDNLIQNDYLSPNYVPGLSLSIVSSNGELFISKGYGLQDVENGLPVTSDTIFGIGSITKSFTATLVVKTLSQLYPDRSEAVLDVPIKQLFPSYNLTITDRHRSDSLTFRDLLAHRTCLTPEFLAVIFGNYNGLPDFLYRQRFTEEACAFRADFLYNNGPVILAGDIIAAMVNSTAKEMMYQFFQDLGMTSSSVILDAVDYDTMVNMTKMYYRRNDQTLKFNPELIKKISPAISSGSILSTANAMTKYMLFHLNGGKVGSNQIVPEDVMGWLRRNSMHLPLSGYLENSQTDYGYGLGFYVGIDAGFQRIHHGGYVAPFLSLLSFYPELNLGIFTTQNGPGLINDLTDKLHHLHSQILAILRGVAPTKFLLTPFSQRHVKIPPALEDFCFGKIDTDTTPSEHSTGVKKRASHTGVASPIQFVGRYGNAISGDFVITIVEEVLHIQFGKWGIGTLLQRSDTLYEIQLTTDIAHEFYASGPVLPEFWVEFYSSDDGQSYGKAGIFLSGELVSEFIRDFDFGTYPSKPWVDENCENRAGKPVIIAFGTVFLVLAAQISFMWV